MLLAIVWIVQVLFTINIFNSDEGIEVIVDVVQINLYIYKMINSIE